MNKPRSGSDISIAIPAKNESENLKTPLPRLIAAMSDVECMVVNDGSSDDTVEFREHNGVIVVAHPYNKGDGAAIKTGAKTASGDVIVFLDGDGQHKPEDIPKLLENSPPAMA